MIQPTTIHILADSISASHAIRSYISPVIDSLCAAAGLVCALFLTTGGYHYMTSTGSPENLYQAKRTIRNAIIGLVVVLGAAVLTTILSSAYNSSSAAISSHLPALTTLQPAPVSNGLLDILIKAVTGFLNNIIQAIASPVLKALTYFTTATPLMAENSAVFNLWLVTVAIADSVFVLIVALLGFHIMGASTFGFDELDFKHLLPRIALIFALINCSIFAIDGVIELSNAMIDAINAAGGSTTSVWDVLTNVVQQATGQGVAALLIMVAFLVFALILLVYYVSRLVSLFIGAVLSPLVLLLWLIPGFRDFSETAAKIYLTTIFVLFVHVIILELAASLFTGLNAANGGTTDTLMAMVVGLSTLIALLKTQGVMNQLSYVSLGPRTARKLGGQFITGVSALTKSGQAVSSGVKKITHTHVGSSGSSSVARLRYNNQAGAGSQPKGTASNPARDTATAAATSTPTPSPRNQANGSTPKLKTDQTAIAPNVASPRPTGNLQDKLKADKKALKSKGGDSA